MARTSFFAVFAAALLVACVAVPPVRPPAPRPSATPAVPPPNLRGPWVVTTPLSQRVALRTEAVIAFGGDGASRTDTMVTALEASFVWASRARRRVDGTLTDYRLSIGGAPALPMPGLTLPRAFTAEASGAGFAFRTPAQMSACTDPSHSVLQQLRDTWISLPDTLLPGREWSDTLGMTFCRDRIPLHGEVARRFRVLRAEMEDGVRLVALVDGTSRMTLAGDGDQFGERVALTGEGAGTLRYVIDATTGHLLRAAGNSSLSLSFRSSRRYQTVRQELRSTITWLP